MPSYEVRKARHGRGLFATKSFRAGARIIAIPGRRVSADEVWDVGGRFADNCFRYGPETYLDPGEGPGRWVNHSCAPNAGVGKAGHRLYLFADRPIKAGEEILIDYSTILGADDIWTMRCACGSSGCRRIVRNIARVPGPVRQRYMDRGLVPPFIVRTL